ncbi:MAG: hypothetical protein AAF409_05155 [Pseudomonadota bacterium]
MFENSISKVSRKLVDPDTGQQFLIGMDAKKNTYIIDTAAGQNGTHFVRTSESGGEDDPQATSNVLKRVALGTGGVGGGAAIMMTRDAIASKTAGQIGDIIYNAPQVDGFQFSKQGADQIGKIVEGQMRSPLIWHVFQFLSLFSLAFGLRRAIFGDEPFLDTLLKTGLVSVILYAGYLLIRHFFGT